MEVFVIIVAAIVISFVFVKITNLYARGLSKLEDSKYKQMSIEDKEPDEGGFYSIDRVRARLNTYHTYTMVMDVRDLLQKAMDLIDESEKLGEKLRDIERMQGPEMIELFNKLEELLDEVQADVQQNSRDILAICTANKAYESDVINLSESGLAAVQEEVSDSQAKLGEFRQILNKTVQQIGKANNHSGSDLSAWIDTLKKLNNQPTTINAG
jgi:hypothetical protein